MVGFLPSNVILLALFNMQSTHSRKSILIVLCFPSESSECGWRYEQCLAVVARMTAHQWCRLCLDTLNIQ